MFRLATGPHNSHVWPSPEQSLLLDAALKPAEAAARAFREWQTVVDVREDFDWQNLRLLPLVYSNLRAHGVDDPLMPRLRGVYRRTWAEMQTLLHRVEPVVRALREANIPVLLLKGAPLSLTYYRNAAHRPMTDFDFAVPRDDAWHAVRALQALGWQPSSPMSDERIKWFHALQFFHPSGGELDLHFHVMAETTVGETDHFFWDTAEVLSFRGHAVSMLAPTELLFHTIIHGVRWNYASPIRWIPDALTVLAQRGSEIDWNVIALLAERLRVTHRVGLGATYLATQHGVEIPEHVLRRLTSHRVDWKERLEASVLLTDRSSEPKHFLMFYYQLLADFARVCEPRASMVTFLWEYPKYLCYRLNVRSRRELLPIALRGMANHLGLRPRQAQIAHAKAHA